MARRLLTVLLTSFAIAIFYTSPPLVTVAQSHAYPSPVIESATVWSRLRADGVNESMFFAGITGPSPEDVVSFTVEGPSGTFDLAPGSSSREQGLLYSYRVSLIVRDGAYTFEVKDSLGHTVSAIRNFVYNSILPEPDSASMTPQNGAYVGTTTPTLSFDPAVTSGMFYRVIVFDYDYDAIWYLSPITQETSFEVPDGLLQPNTPYIWFFRIYDSNTEPQNVRESQHRAFYTSTKQAPTLSSIKAIVSWFYETDYYYKFMVRETGVAPWDISALSVTTPDSSVYNLEERDFRFYCPVYYLFYGTASPPAVPDGSYSFYIQDDDGGQDTQGERYDYNPVPQLSEGLMIPADNAYFDTNRPTFDWDPVEGDGNYYYSLRILDYSNRIVWYDSPFTTETSVSVPDGVLLWGNSYKWQVVVSDADGRGGSINNANLSSDRTFTIAGKTVSHTITAKAGSHGSISPPETLEVVHGGSQTFTITPDLGYRVADVLVDGSSEGPKTNHTFENVRSDHTIEATFVIDTCVTTASAGPHGSIIPVGNVEVTNGSCETFEIAPDEGYRVEDVEENGMSVGAVTSHAICCDVTSAPTSSIHATFIDDIAPSVSITSPAEGPPLNQLFLAGGEASDQGSGVSKVELQITDGTHYLTQNQWWTTTPTWMTVAGADIWLFNTNLVHWSSGTQYSVAARATDEAGNTSSPFSVDFTYQEEPGARAYTTLSLDLSSQSIENGGIIDAAGKLTRLPDTGEDLSDLTITLTVTDPDDLTKTYTTNTYSEYGHYQFEGLSWFTQKGVYEIQTSFNETETLYEASSDVQTLMVGASAGYAIIVVGKVSDGEGFASHNKTAKRIYQRLKARGFADENIKYFNYDTLHEAAIEPSKPGVQTAIEVWAAGKMISSPAPLWIIMVDHGWNGVFYMDDDKTMHEEETITPTELDSWLNALEENLGIVNPEALNEKRVLVIGTCYSGSFISSLSREGRVIVTSAAEDEESYKGPAEPPEPGEPAEGIRSGEFFLEKLFEELKGGNSLWDSFLEATEKTERFTRKGGDLGHAANRYFDDAMQHPLLDDNADGQGSNVLSEGYGDGILAKDIFLGISETYDLSPSNDSAEIVNVTETVHLNASPATISYTMWAEANDNNSVSTAWMEVRFPSLVLSLKGGTEQPDVPLDRELMTLSGGRWEETYDSFGQAGKYEVYYFVRDVETGEFSPAKRSVVYKNRTDNEPPSSFNLVSPDNGSEQKTLLILDWEDSIDPDGVTYTILISADAAYDNVVYRQEEVPTSITLIDGTAGLEDLTTYFWKVGAVDSFGSVTESKQSWTFTTNNTNAFPGFIKGRVYNVENYLPIMGANVSTDAGISAVSQEQGIFLMLVPAGTFTVSCSGSGYEDVSIENVSVSSGGSAGVNFEMVPGMEKGDVNNDGTVDLADAVSAMQLLAGIEPISTTYKQADVNEDGKVGFQEVVYALHHACGLGISP